MRMKLFRSESQSRRDELFGNFNNMQPIDKNR